MRRADRPLQTDRQTDRHGLFGPLFWPGSNWGVCMCVWGGGDYIKKKSLLFKSLGEDQGNDEVSYC